MTIANEDARTGPYNGNGATTAFDYDFKVVDQAHLVVTLTDASSVDTVQTITTHYTVSGVGDEGGGSITMVTAPATGELLTITRDVTRTQEVDLQNRGSFLPNTIERAFDKLTQITQDLDEQLTRAVKQPVTSTTELAFPAPTGNANKVVIFNTGDGTDATDLEAGPTTTQITNAETNATAAAASAAAAATSESNAATSETNAANSAASAAASAQGFSGVTLLTASSNDVETTDARTYYQVDASSNTVSINLPSIGTGNDGLFYTIEVLDVTNAITLVRDGTDTINGVAGNYTGLVEAGQVIQIIANDGVPDDWIVVQASALKVDDSTVELTGRTIRVKNNGISGDKIAMGSDAQGDILYYDGADYTRLPAGTSGQMLQTQGAGANPQWADAGGGITDNGSVSVNSGSSVSLATGISGATRITIIFDSVSLNGSNDMYIQLGDSGGLETTGYTGVGTSMTGAGVSNTTTSAGFLIDMGGGASDAFIGHMTLTHYGSNQWVASYSGACSTTRSGVGGGTKTLSGELDRISIRTTSGSFDGSGKIKLFIE
jgi:hypothetical protein